MRKAFRQVFFVIILLACSNHHSWAQSDLQWQDYKGAWFKVEYPADFTVKPSIKSTTSVKGYDSAFFVSPDQSVEFYIFSPMWNGVPSDIQLNPKTEKLVSETTEDVPDKPHNMGMKSVRRYTIVAKDSSYLRSYVDTENKVANTRFVVGLKYNNMETYNAYKDRYLRFKESLKQYLD